MKLLIVVIQDREHKKINADDSQRRGGRPWELYITRAS